MNNPSQFFAMDFGNSTTSVACFNPNGEMIHPVYLLNTTHLMNSVVKVTENSLDYVQTVPKILSPGYYITNFKMLLGRVERDLKPELREESLYGAPVRFDENHHPYFHCEFNTQTGMTTVRNIYPEELFLVVLKKALDEVIAHSGHSSMKYCTFTVPHYTTNRARHLMRQAASKLGLECNFMLKEPTAAGIQYLSPPNPGARFRGGVNDGDTILVFDFGAGTLDISIIRRNGNSYEVIGCSGDPLLGGNVIDKAVVSYVMGKYQSRTRNTLFANLPKKERRFRMMCKEAREALSSDDSVIIDLEDFGIDDEIILTQDEFERSIMKDILSRISMIVRKAIQSIHDHSSQINHIMLVGGSSNIPCIRKLFESYSYNILEVANMQEVVSEGACLATLHDLQQNNIVEDIII